MLGVSLYCFVVGELTGNVSQTDKLWSIPPTKIIKHKSRVFGLDFLGKAALSLLLILAEKGGTLFKIESLRNDNRSLGFLLQLAKKV